MWGYPRREVTVGLPQERSYCGATPGEELLLGYLKRGATVGLLQERSYCGATPGEELLWATPYERNYCGTTPGASYHAGSAQVKEVVLARLMYEFITSCILLFQSEGDKLLWGYPRGGLPDAKSCAN